MFWLPLCSQVLYNAFKRIVSHLPAEDKAKLFYANAARLYRLSDLPQAKA